MTRKADRGDLSPHAAAIERWDNEGGASSQASEQEKAKTVRNTSRSMSANGDEQEAQERADET
jgi:hypothetical protein